MVLEARQVYRVQPSDPDRLVDQLNQILTYIADRLDRSESLRDDARMHGNLNVDGNINCGGDLDVAGTAALGDTTGTSTIVETIIVEELIVTESLLTVAEIVTGSATADALSIGNDYIFPTNSDAPDQTALFYASLIVHGNTNIGGDVVVGQDLTVGGDMSVAGSITAKTATVHGELVLVDETGTQLHGWIAP